MAKRKNKNIRRIAKAAAARRKRNGGSWLDSMKAAGKDVVRSNRRRKVSWMALAAAAAAGAIGGLTLIK